MTRGCAICQAPKAKKAICCGQKLCLSCTDNHVSRDLCPRAREIAAIADDPKKLAQWKKDHAPEEELTTLAIEEINKLPGVEVHRTKRKQGAGKSDELDGVLDIAGDAAPDGRAIYVEMKGTHPDGCACPSCGRQRDFAARAEGRGAVVVLGARTVRQAVDGVRLGLARARGRSAA